MQTRERSPMPRREFLGALAASSAAVTIGALPATSAAAQSSHSAIADLWHRALEARGVINAAAAAIDAAEEQLPWWAKPGPSCVNSEGEFCGEVSFTPASQHYTLPKEGSSARTCIRVGEGQIRALFDHEAAIWGEEQMRPRFDERMAKLNARIEAAQREHERVNMPVLNEKSDAAGDASCECDDAIRRLPTTSMNVLAAQVMTEAFYICERAESVDDQSALSLAALVLKGLLPQLTGEIAVDAAEIVNHTDRPMDELRFARGIAPQSTEAQR